MMELARSHNFPRLYDLQKEKKWAQKEGMSVSDRVGKKVGILGYGSIGRQGESHNLFFNIKVVREDCLQPPSELRHAEPQHVG